MLNEVKHLLCAFPTSSTRTEKSNRFFVAEFILSMAEGLLRMTHEGKVFAGSEPPETSDVKTAGAGFFSLQAFLRDSQPLSRY
jgi:hypothetical protein